MKRLLLALTLLSIAGVEAKAKAKKMKAPTTTAARMKKKAGKPVLGGDPATYTPKNMPQPKGQAKKARTKKVSRGY